MKQIELVIIGLVVLILFAYLGFEFIPVVIPIFTLLTVASIYFYFGGFIIKGQSLNEIKQQFKEKGIRVVLNALHLSGVAIGMILIGLLFTVSNWPGGNTMLLYGTVVFILTLLVAYFRKSKNKHFELLSKRAFIFLPLAFYFLSLEPIDVVSIRYRNHPDYVEAYTNSHKNYIQSKDFESKLKAKQTLDSIQNSFYMNH